MRKGASTGGNLGKKKRRKFKAPALYEIWERWMGKEDF